MGLGTALASLGAGRGDSDHVRFLAGKARGAVAP